jgi:hypothetical protein
MKSTILQLPKRPIFWLHVLIIVSALFLYSSTRVSLGKEMVMGDELSLAAIAGWSAKGAKWLLAITIVLAVVGRGAAALAAGGAAIGLIVAPVMQFFRDAMSMREIMPELADKPLSELFEKAAGSNYLGVGIVLWLLVLLALAIKPNWHRRVAAAQTEEAN